jgi:penicillin amidase
MSVLFSGFGLARAMGRCQVDVAETFDQSMTRPNFSSPRRKFRWLKGLLIALPLMLGVSCGVAWMLLSGSLPQLDGTYRAAATLSAPVTVERDALGVATLRGGDRDDLAYGTGFVHAQDRFFQMDLLRRVAAGEMAELIGPTALELDRRNRVHRFRARARTLFDALPFDQRQLIERYAAGVNDGLASLDTRPFEHWLLRAQPAAWRPEDTVLVVYAMYFDLQYHELHRILSRAALRERVPAILLSFMLPATSRWDAPFDDPAPSSPTLPLPSSLPAPPALRTSRSSRFSSPSLFSPASTILGDTVSPPAARPAWLQAPKAAGSTQPDFGSMTGSNGWVVDGARSAHGGAILANDMHLGLALPNIWYRLSLDSPSPDGHARHITGVSLPGTPLVVSGSNGQVAWGFTNSYGNFIDLIELQRNPADALQYRIPEGGWERATVHSEPILVKGGMPVDLPVVETRWGPQILMGSRAYAVRWVAHDREAVNLSLQRLEDSANVADALRVAQRSGVPTQNFMVADSAGAIGWTLAGPLPQRGVGVGADAPAAPADNAHATDIRPATAPDGLPFKSDTYRGWQHYLPPHAYPQRVDPPLGRLWSANNRAMPLAEQALLGDSGADVGARASQIRDDLLAHPHASERDLLAIQTDDRALWIDTWRRAALSALDADALRDHPQRVAFRRVVDAWNGRADADAAGYRLVRAFYFSLYDAWFGKLDSDLAALDPHLGYRVASSRYLAVMEILATQHAWVPDGFADWRAFMLDRIDHAIGLLTQNNANLDRANWGARNRAAIEHPFARIIPPWLPWLRERLGAPRDPLPGDINMPRVQAPTFGASDRMVVSPGRERDGIFQMPGGQSGHPLSPYFLAGHDAWARGEPAGFLPGAALHRLELIPSAH